MKIAAKQGYARLAGLLLLSLLAAAVFVPAALAINDTGSGTGGVSYAWARTAAATGTSVASFQAGTHGRGGVAVPEAQVAVVAPVAAAPVAATTPSSGTSSTTWIVIGVALAALAVALVAWALVRRRRRLASDTQQYCSLHPEDALCGAA